MQMKIKKIILDSFRGCKHAEYDFPSDRVDVVGKNGSGKTTIMTAHMWLWADKDSELNSNPELHPLNVTESEPSITEIVEINGTEIVVKKIQQDARTKKQRENGDPIRIKNVFEINSVPKSQKDFVKDLEERGVFMDDFLMCCHPEVFINQKTADCRKFLFAMAKAESDKDIADSMPDCKELAERLNTRKLEEVEAEMKSLKKLASNRLDSIPSEIIGLERSIVEIPIKELSDKKQELESKVEELNKTIDSMPEQSKDEINKSIANVKAKQAMLIREANADREHVTKQCKITADEAHNEYKNLCYEQNDIERQLKRLTSDIADVSERCETAKTLMDEIKNTKIPENLSVCPTCGQNLPSKEAANAVSNWKKEMNDKYVTHRSVFKKSSEDLITYSGKKIELIKSLEDIKQKIAESEKKYDKLLLAYIAAQDAPLSDGSDIAEYQECEKQLESLQAQLNAVDENNAKRYGLMAEKKDILFEIHSIDVELGKDDVNKHTRQEIETLREEQKIKGQELSNAEKILYQIAALNMEKNNRLEASVNSRFPDYVKFRLFRYQKNGECKDDCTPLIQDESGEWKDFNASANTGLKILGKFGIISGIQNVFEQSLPVFLDGAEALDKDSKSRIDIDTQVIFLTVKDDMPLTIES